MKQENMLSLPSPTCEGCGKEQPGELFPVEVNLKDGTRRQMLLCGNLCADFWDDTIPGLWVELLSGELVQRRYWMCDICSNVWEHNGVKKLVDTLDDDPDTPRDLDTSPQAEYIVCARCQKSEKDRFRTREEITGH